MNNNNTQNNLEQTYNLLNYERYQTEKIEREFETLNSANENSKLVVNSNYYKFIVLSFITILLFCLLIKYVFARNQIEYQNNYKGEFILLLLLLFIIAYFIVKFG